ncbi:MAG: hypothetical protein KDA20_10980 [Phycisphaerales bacterium]|nr:hypothetical protein [Phycisphaerales bacterium]
MSRKLHTGAGAALLGCAIFSLAAHAAPNYTVTDLGTLGGDAITRTPGSLAHAISPSGEVVGMSVLGDAVGGTRAFRWMNGSMMMLMGMMTDMHAAAYDMNASRTIVGVSFELGDQFPKAVRWMNGGMTMSVLGDFEPRAINDAGVIVGHRHLAIGAAANEGVIYDAGVITPIGSLGGTSSAARDINTNGDIVGHASVAGDLHQHAFFLSAGASTPSDLGTLGGAQSEALAVNDARQVVGMAWTATGAHHAFLAQVNPDGSVQSMQDLGTLAPNAASYAYAINNSGEIVGTSDSRAVLWENGAPIDLHTLALDAGNWEFYGATSISDAGEIVGYGRRDGRWRAFLLRPSACMADIDGSGVVDLPDLNAMLLAFGMMGGPADIDGDGTVTIADLNVLLFEFGSVCN